MMKIKIGSYRGLELEVPEEHIEEIQTLNKEWKDCIEEIRINNEQTKKVGDEVLKRMNSDWPDNKENWNLLENKEKRSCWWKEVLDAEKPYMDKHMLLVSRIGEICEKIENFVGRLEGNT